MKIFAYAFRQEELLYSYYKGEALIRSNYPFFIPDTSVRYVATAALALRIGRTGKEVAPRFAHRYIQEIGYGFDLFAPDKLKNLRSIGAPWEEAVAFEYASSAGAFISAATLPSSVTLHYGEGEERINTTYITEAMIRTAIASLSSHNIIHTGDILLLHDVDTTEITLSIEKVLSIVSSDNAAHPHTLRIK